jgi:hypothetical protein
MSQMRTPKVGDRVAIPNHAVVLIVKRVDHLNQTVDVDLTREAKRIQEGIPWSVLTFIDA